MWNQVCGGSSGLQNGRSDIDAREYTGKSENVYGLETLFGSERKKKERAAALSFWETS
jgi:hypothetical protein